MQLSRRSILGGAIPLIAGASQRDSSSLAAELDGTAGAALADLQAKASQFKTFQDFGAAGNYDLASGSGTDDTAAIQAAIDWAYGDGRAAGRALLMTANNFLCGPITTRPYTTIIGTGRHTSSFVCKPGTRGRWWSDNGFGAQKLMLSGIAWYGRDEPGLTHICCFGADDIQFGTEGILQGLWMRDASRSTGLLVNGNVGIVRDVTIQGCETDLKVLGNGNQLENIICMEAGAVGADLSGCFVCNLHVEATASDGLPLRINGDTRVTHLLISTATRHRYSHLIEVDIRNYDEWSIGEPQFLGTDYVVSNGIYKVGSSYRGGTNPGATSGKTYLRAVDVHSGELSIRDQLWQSFSLQIHNDAGTIKHRVGSLAEPSAPTAFSTRINGATHISTASPAGPDRSQRFSGGGKIGNPSPSRFIFDTAPQIGADQAIQAVIQHNNCGTALTVWAHFAAIEVNGARRTRLVVEFFDAATGAAFPLTALSTGKSITVGLSGFLA